MLDLLRVTIEAGRAPLAAMGWSAQRFDGPLAAEWRAAAAQVALGVPHGAALEQVGTPRARSAVCARSSKRLRTRDAPG